MSDKFPVYTVDNVEARMEGTILHVEATGTTRTGGWTNPELVPSDVPGGDVMKFNFVATPPDGASTDAITPIEASYQSGPLRPPFPKEVYVQAETNSKSAPVGPGGADSKY